MNRIFSLVLIAILISTTVGGIFYPRPSHALIDDICGAYSSAVSRAQSALSRINISTDVGLPDVGGIDLPDVGGGFDVPGIDIGFGGGGGSAVPTRDDATRRAIQDAQKKTIENSRAQACQNFIERTALATLKNRLLNMMVDQIIDWINGNGKPMFITDYKTFLKNAGNVAVGDLIQDAGWGAVCEPFRANLRLTLQLQNTVFSQRASCSFSQVRNNFQDFYNDFAKGGWVFYNEAWKPANNPYGAFIIAYDESNRRRAEAEQAAELQALAGGGFTGQTQCNEWKYLVGGPSGQYVGDPVRNSTFPVDPPAGEPATGEWICTNYSVTTPGSVAEGVTTKAIGSSIDQVIQSNDLSDYAGAIASAAINRLIKEGVDGISGLSLPSINNDRKPEPTGCEGLSGDQLSICLSNSSNYNRIQTYEQRVSNEYDAYSASTFQHAPTTAIAFDNLVSARNQINSMIVSLIQITSSSIATTTQLIASTTAVARCYINATTTLQRAQSSLVRLQEIQADTHSLDAQLSGVTIPQPSQVGQGDDYDIISDLLQSLATRAATLKQEVKDIGESMQSFISQIEVISCSSPAQ